MARKYVKLVLIPEDGGPLRQIRVPQGAIHGLVAALIAATVLMVGAGCTYLRLLSSASAASDLRSENETLRAELISMGCQITQLDGLARNHIRLANDSRLLAGLSPIEEEVALLGVGGTPEPERPAQGRLQASLARSVDYYHERLQDLSRQLHFQEDNFTEVRQVLEANRDRLSCIPTINPIASQHYVSSGFGNRRDPFTGQTAFHPGLDLCAPRGTPIRTPADGVVFVVETAHGLGRTVRIDHGNGYQTVYGHCDRILVREGQRVSRGENIAEVGNTGRSTGFHLHYEVHQNGRVINPRPFIIETRTFS